MREDYPPPEPSQETLDQLNARIVVSKDPCPLYELRCFPMHPHGERWAARLREGGRELVLAAIESGWLFLWIVDVEKERVERRISIPILHRELYYGSCCEITLDRDTLWLITNEDLVEISLPDGRIRSWRSYAELLPGGTEHVWLLPGSRHLWVEGDSPRGLYVIDLESFRLDEVILGEVDEPLDVPGSSEPLFAFVGIEDSRLCRCDGTAVPGGDLPRNFEPRSLVHAPNGPGLLAMRLEPVEGEDWEILHWEHLVDDGGGAFQISAATSRRWVYDDNPPRGSYRLAVSHESETAFMLCQRWEKLGYKILYGISVSERGIRTRYRVPVPCDLKLCQEPRGQRVVALFTDGEGLRAVPLTRRRPSELEPLASTEYDERRIQLPRPELEIDDSCIEPGRGTFLLYRELDEMDPSIRRTVLGHMKAGLRDDAAELANLYCVLAKVESWTKDRFEKEEIGRHLEEISGLLKNEHADHPAAALMLASIEAIAGRWRQVDRWLDVAEKGSLEDRRHRRHLHHLRALVLLHTGRPDEAFAELSKDSARAGRWSACRLGELRELTEPMADPPTAGEWGPQRRLLRQLLGAIRITNRAFEAGHLAKVIETLDRPAIWQINEIETAARRAAAWLASPVSGKTARIEKRFCLARFCEAFTRPFKSERVLLPGVTWEEARILSLEREARAWLATEHVSAPGQDPESAVDSAL